MSGPKISLYSLTGRQRQIVFGQMRCEQQSLSCHAQTMETLRRLLGFSGDFDRVIGNIRLLMKRTGEGAEQIEELQKLRADINAEADKIKKEAAAARPRASAKYRVTEEALAEKQAELKKIQAIKSKADALGSRLEKALANDKSNASAFKDSILRDMGVEDGDKKSGAAPGYLARDAKNDVRKIEASIVEDLNSVSSFDLDSGAQDAKFAAKKEAIAKELSQMLGKAPLPDDLAEQIKKAAEALKSIKDEARLATFSSVTVAGLSKKADTHRRENAKKLGEFKELCQRYEALCAMAEEEPKTPPFSPDAAATLNAEIERLELMLVRRQEQSYISECVDDIMSDMGYDLIGTREVRKKNGKHFRNELFKFNEGTAVNVTFSPDGQISMELGGLAREDRIPNEAETEVLCGDMESFCTEFKEFERRLREKGIVVRDRVALCPPTAENAAIINVDDYNVEAGAEIEVLDAVEKRTKQTEKKARRIKGE